MLTFDDTFLSMPDWINEDSLKNENNVFDDIDLASVFDAVCLPEMPEKKEKLTYVLERKTQLDILNNYENAKNKVKYEVVTNARSFINRKGRVVRGKPCCMEGCDNRSQSKGLCKSHGGGTRCIEEGCDKSSQGNQRCRNHGGGKRCMFPGCNKGTQRKGVCYLHYKQHRH